MALADRILNLSTMRAATTDDESVGARSERRFRVLVFVATFALVAGAGLVYDFSRTAVYRATARLSVDPPHAAEDPVAKAQFALAEAQYMRRSDLAQAVARHLGAHPAADADGPARSPTAGE